MSKDNLVLITIDSLRFDHLGMNGYHRETDSKLVQFRRKGVNFENVYSNGSNTETSFPSILSFQKKLSHDTVFLSEVLKNSGYSTIGIHSNPYLRFYKRGFDVFCDLEEVPINFDDKQSSIRSALKEIIERLLPYNSTRRDSVYELSKLYQFFIAQKRTPYANAEVVNERAFQFLDAVEQPFFLWVHYMDVHMPYLPPVDYRPPIDTFTSYFLNQRLLRTCARKSMNVFSKMELQKLIDLYDGAIIYLNNQIKSLFDGLEEIGVSPDDTFFVIVSDHGDEFGEEGGIGHPPFRDIEALLHVPLLMMGPNMAQGKISETITLDYLNPNIIKLLDLPVPNKLQHKVLF